MQHRIAAVPAAAAPATPAVQLTLAALTLAATLAVAGLVWWSNNSATTQRENQARREEWWRRFQWAATLAVDTDELRKRVGVALAEAIMDSPLAEEDELQAAVAVMDEVAANNDNEAEEANDDNETET